MKHSFLIFLLLTAYVSFSSAQEDTIRVYRQSEPTLSLSDSLLLNRNKVNIEAITDNPTNTLECSVLSTPQDEMTLHLDDVTPKKGFFNSSYSKFIIPTTLITYGVLTRTNKSLRNLDLSTNNEVGEHISKKNPFDNYIQFAPAVAVYGLDFAGVKAKHNFRDRTLVMATAYLIMGTTVATMKTTTHIERPNGSNDNSFPSGHTATAFVGAHILFMEYKDVSPWIGIGGYTVATATATMRILNKKHWISDVVTGAGIGLLSAELGYILLPVWHSVLGIKQKDKNLVILPIASPENMGMALAYTF